MGSEMSVVARIAPPAIASPSNQFEFELRCQIKSTHPVGCGLCASRDNTSSSASSSLLGPPQTHKPLDRVRGRCHQCTMSPSSTRDYGLQQPRKPQARQCRVMSTGAGSEAARTSSSSAATRFAICFRDNRTCPPAAPATRAGMVHPYPNGQGAPGLSERPQPRRREGPRGYASVANPPQHVGRGGVPRRRRCPPAAKIGWSAPAHASLHHTRSDARGAIDQPV